LAARSSLARLVGGLKREPHDYRASLDIFPALNVAKLAADMAVGRTGAARGAEGEPTSDSAGFDDIENRIVERVEAEKNSAHGILLDELQLYKERLTGLDFEGRFATIRQAAPAAVTEFRAEAAQGRDELHSLRRHLRDVEVERDDFRRRHRLIRTARVSAGGNLSLKLGVLMCLFVFEVFLNGFFLAKGSELGYVGGAAEALTFALFNIGVSFLAGAVAARELNHRNVLRKLIGFLLLVGYLVLAVGLNLTLAHYREAAGSLVSDAGHEVLVRLRTNPLGIADVKSWLFFGIGMLCSLIAFGDSYLIFDPYPGYGTLEKRRASAYAAYIRRKNELIAALLEIRDEAIEILEDANRDLAIRRSEHDAILEGRSRVIRLFEAHQTHLDRTANALLSTYREANKRSRASPPPARFAVPYALDRIPVDNDPGPVSARDDLRRSIEESQAVLVEQVHAIHHEFERAFASYREIDDLVEERTFERSKAAAA
jgi:predicted metal-dependent hydrolase